MGVILKSETKTEDMVSICEELHKYVPTTSTEYIVDVTDSGETKQFNVTSDVFHYTLFGKSCVYLCMIYNNVLIAFKEEIS